MSVRLKRAAAALLAPSGVLRLGGITKNLVSRQLLLLGYHRVLPIEAAHVGDIDLVSATPEEFAWQMEYVQRRFEPVTFAQIADALDGEGVLPKRAVAITFDDGFFDLHTHAFPILRRLGMPATMFVSTDYVDQSQPFWFDLVAWLIMQAPPASIRLTPTSEPVPAADSDAARRVAVVKTLKWLKNCDQSECTAAVAALCEQFPDEVAKGRAQLGRGLTWDQVREMAAGGIEFGSHTASHCCLTKVEPQQLDRELVHSKRRLEQQLGKPITAIAYPFGGRAAFDDTVIAAVRRAGYRVAASYMPGVNDLRMINRFALLRQHVELDTNRAYFQALVNAPELFD